ncbi:transmembrane protein 56-B-like [Trifolium pratense]|uniref:Transmembrane protein 56-B-like n=1 Tax=Trifolium pratense TaxID=57577 RepID=A0A2K3NX77_TRIPR|nr:transmembrane protein 56-B-like [Trifolium pratense]PNY07613.1 transmembrane protein 56-B-like [Trifolium pratense]
MGIPFSFGFLTTAAAYDFVAPTKEIQWLVSVFAGIIFSLIVYRFTAIFSSRLFAGYRKLTGAVKVEWNNRGFSTFHALFAAFTSLYLLILSDLFKDGSQEKLVVNRSSAFSNSVLSFSTGYFLTDLAFVIWNFPALGGLEYVLHHGLSLFSIIQSLLIGQAQIYILMVLFTESTTPFVNLRWYLDTAGLKSSKLYIWNGIALFFGWLVLSILLLVSILIPLFIVSEGGAYDHSFTVVARIFLFIFLFTHMWTHFDEVKQVVPLGFYSLLAVPSVLAVMNLFWFWKIAKGMVKTISKAKHSKLRCMPPFQALMFNWFLEVWDKSEQIGINANCPGCNAQLGSRKLDLNSGSSTSMPNSVLEIGTQVRGQNHMNWAGMWEVRAPPKSRYILRRVCRWCIPTCSRLIQRHADCFPLRSLCNEEVKEDFIMLSILVLRYKVVGILLG